METHHPLIEAILRKWQERIGEDYAGSRGHVYPMLNYCLALHPASDEEKTKLAMAACFHDIGLRSDNPLYLISHAGKRAEKAAQVLRETGLEHLALVQGGTEAW